MLVLYSYWAPELSHLYAFLCIQAHLGTVCEVFRFSTET